VNQLLQVRILQHHHNPLRQHASDAGQLLPAFRRSRQQL
jgi:hypothetical protein